MRVRNGTISPLLRIVRAMRSMTTTSLPSSHLLACNVYISEGQNVQAIEHLRRTVTAVTTATTTTTPQTTLLANVFIDRPYNRSNFTLISRNPLSLAQSALSLSLEALATLDLTTHVATHPRLGIVDHISCHPLDSHPTTLAQSVESARYIAKSLAEKMPVFLYGDAALHSPNKELADIRRCMGYFKSDNTRAHTWEGSESIPIAFQDANPTTATTPRPDYYDPATNPYNPAWGVCCIGAVPWIMNVNVLLNSDDLPRVKQITNAVSGRCGGLKGVQAMALRHERGIEVACNLLNPMETTAEMVTKYVEMKAKELGVTVLDSYCTGKTREELISLATKSNLQ